MSEFEKAELESAEANAGDAAAKAPMDKRKRLCITLDCVVAVLVLAGAGLMVWHEQPSFCAAICHDPHGPVPAHL